MTADRITGPVPGRPDAAPTTGSPFRLTLLGGFGLLRAERAMALGPGAQRLLALLAIRGPTARADAAGVLWPDVHDTQAMARLRTALWRLGRSTHHLLDTAPDRLALTPGVEVDLRAFLTVAMRLEGTRHDDRDLSLFRTLTGELLPGWYDDWVLAERERVRQMRLHGWESVARALCERGQYTGAVDAALQAIRLEPLRESAHRVLLEIHMREGNLVEALRCYRSYAQMLREELDVAPSPRLAALCSREGTHRDAAVTPTTRS